MKTVETIVSKLGHVDGVQVLLQDDLIMESKPLPFPKNKHGHYMLPITGKRITGEQDKARVKENGFCVSQWANQLLTSSNADGYDKNHCLEDGKQYNVVLVPSREVTKKCTTKNIEQYARGFGYEMSLAGVMPRILEMVSSEQIEKMNVSEILGFHKPITDNEGDLSALRVHHSCDNQWLGAYDAKAHGRWGDDEMCVFFDPKG